MLRSLIAVTVCWTVSTASQPETSRFFPMAVWYGGGKARAPMLETTRGPRRSSGARTCAPSRPPASTPSAHGSIGHLASLPRTCTTFRPSTSCWSWPKRKVSSWRFRCTWTRRHFGSGRSIRIRCSSPRMARQSSPSRHQVIAAIIPLFAQRTTRLCGARTAGQGQAGIHRLGPLERAACHQLGEPDMDSESRVLFLHQYRAALPGMAAQEVRIHREPQRRVVAASRPGRTSSRAG